MRLVKRLALVLPLFITPSTSLMAADWDILGEMSMVTFTADNLGLTFIHGRFSSIEGTVRFDPANPEDGEVDLIIATDSLTSGYAARDDAILGPDMLAAANFPTIRFQSTGVEVTSPTTAKLHGELTIRDVTRPESFDVVLRSLGPYVFDPRLVAAGFVAETTIERADYGAEFALPAIANTVDVRIDLAISTAAEIDPEIRFSE